MGTPSGHAEPVVAQLAEVWGSIVAACADLGDAQWELATDCPGWTVKDQVSHLIGIERMLLGDPAPPDLVDPPDHVVNEFGRINEAWVASRRPVPGDAVLAEFVEVTGRKGDALASMGEQDFDRVGWSPLGEQEYRHFMESRVLDSWAHEQDIRRALDRPGGRNGAGESIVLDRCEGTMPYVVGKRVRPPEGTRVLFAVSGPLGRQVLVAMVAGRASLVPPSEGSVPVVTLAMDQETFWRLALGRADPSQAVPSGQVVVDGDQALGHRVLGSMAFMT
jgi:uncharacterized protein (TIGR03083 family)